jgi:hypothetical protein
MPRDRQSFGTRSHRCKSKCLISNKLQLDTKRTFERSPKALGPIRSIETFASPLHCIPRSQGVPKLAMPEKTVIRRSRYLDADRSARRYCHRLCFAHVSARTMIATDAAPARNVFLRYTRGGQICVRSYTWERQPGQSVFANLPGF